MTIRLTNAGAAASTTGSDQSCWRDGQTTPEKAQYESCSSDPVLSSASSTGTELPDPDIQYKTVQAASLQWNVGIAGQGPPCILIHGTGASIHTWRNLLPWLAGRYTLIMMDLPGHAGTKASADTDLSLPGIAGAVDSLLTGMAVKPALMVGHSAGAAVMMQLCLARRDYATPLISINGAVIPLGGLAGYVFSPLARMSSTSHWMSHFFAFRARNRRNIKKLLDSTGSTVDQDSFNSYAELFQNSDHVAGVLRMMANWKLEELAPRLSQLENPVRLIAADCDRTIPLRDAYRLNRKLVNSRLSVIKGKGHLVHEEAPSSVANIILSEIPTQYHGRSDYQ